MRVTAIPALVRANPSLARAAAWVLAGVLLAGSLAAYDSRTTLLASIVGTVIVAGVEPRPMIGRIAAVAAALLLSSLPWAMTLAVRYGEPDLTLPTLSVVPFALGLLLLPVGAGRMRRALLTVPAFVVTAAATI